MGTHKRFYEAPYRTLYRTWEWNLTYNFEHRTILILKKIYSIITNHKNLHWPCLYINNCYRSPSCVISSCLFASIRACWLFISVDLYSMHGREKKAWCSRFEFLWHQVQVMYSQYLWLKKSCLFMNMHGSFKYAYLQPDEMKVEFGMEIHPIYFTSYCHN